MRKRYRFIFVLLIIILHNIAYANSAIAKSLYYQKKVSRALNQLKEEPHNGKICNVIGFYFYKMGNDEDAAKYYLKAIEIAPDYPLSYNNLGVIYLKRAQYENAEHCFQKAIELDSGYIKAVCNLGVTYYKMKNYSEAKKWYKIAQEIDPQYVNKRKVRFLNKEHSEVR